MKYTDSQKEISAWVKFDDLVFTIPKEFHKWYGFASPRGFFRGTTMMPKAKVYMDFHINNKGSSDGGAAYAPRGR